MLLTCVIGVLAAPLMVWAMVSGLKQELRGHAAAKFSAHDAPSRREVG